MDSAVTPADWLNLLRDALASHRLDATCEADLQEAIGIALTSRAIGFEREVQLAAGDRIDFLVGTIGVEVKIDGSEPAVLRQLVRYARSPRIEALLLVTTKAKHTNVPAALMGKPLRVHFMGGLG